MKQFFIQLFILFMFISQVFAQSGSIINDPATGLQFSIPEGWSGQKADSGYLLGSNSKKGFILIFYHQYKNLDQIRQEAAQEIIDQNGTMLNLEGSLKSISDKRLASQFSGIIEWQQAKSYAASIISPL